MKIEREKGGIIAWHGTDRADFASFDNRRWNFNNAVVFEIPPLGDLMALGA